MPNAAYSNSTESLKSQSVDTDHTTKIVNQPKFYNHTERTRGKQAGNP